MEMAAKPDQGLIVQAASGNPRALTQLLEEHTPAIRKAIAGKIPRRWRSMLTVGDVLQQTYTDAFLGIGGFDPEGKASFATWLNTLAKYNLVDALRMLAADKRGKNWRRIQPPNPEDSFVVLYDRLRDTGTSPSRQVARKEGCAALQRAIQQLPEAYRQVVRMPDIEGRSMDEVAKEMKRSPGAVHMIRVRAHRRLRQLMGSESKYFTKA